MALYIALKEKKIRDKDYYRFKSAFHTFHDLLLNLKVRESKIAFYEHAPLDELNPNFERKNFSFGILESDYRNRLKKLDDESINAGFLIESKLYVQNRSFDIVFEVYPRSNSQYYDIRIEILSNGYANSFEDLEKYIPSLRKKILDRIRIYNGDVEKKDKSKDRLFLIRKAVMSTFREEFHSIDKWKFFYSKDSSEIVNQLSYGYPELRDRLAFANRDKFARLLDESDNFYFKMAEFAQNAQVEVEGGSIAIIPKDEEAMQQFIFSLRKKVYEAAKELFPKESDSINKVNKIFSS